MRKNLIATIIVIIWIGSISFIAAIFKYIPSWVSLIVIILCVIAVYYKIYKSL